MLIKYSIGGPITSIEDKDVVEKREEKHIDITDDDKIAICSKCGIQYMIKVSQDTNKCSCGGIVQIN
jgi:hypothetical protein